ncbi:hypothetical protein SUNI508_13760 [Seiridium unicorne]|uniref:Rhodopsin domain-containing protein n=1 Tax=Seiridium unicorne TaxID=138068 RepID=A0ABR2VBM4_9PEZI
MGTRLIARQRKRVPIGLDDYLAFFAAMGATASTILYGFLIRTGVGYHIYDQQWEVIRTLTSELESKLYFCFEILYTLNSGAAKISALLFYIRVFPIRSLQRASYISIAVLASLTIAFLLISFFACRPFSANWSYELRSNGSCMNRKPSFIVSCIATIITDFLVLSLPLKTIWSLQMEKKIKLGLICVLASGIVVTVFSFVRLYFVVNVDYAYDFTYTGTRAMFFTALEPALMTTCISLPMLYSLFPKRSKTGSAHADKSQMLKPLYGLGRSRRDRREFEPIDESRPNDYDLHTSPVANVEGAPGAGFDDNITVHETFSVREEALRPGDTFNGPDPSLSRGFSTKAWAERI